MNDHKKAEQAQRDQMVEAYLKDVGATVCPPQTFSTGPQSKPLSPEDRVMRSQYYASLTERELHSLDYAPCTDNGVDSSYLKTSTEDTDDDI